MKKTFLSLLLLIVLVGCEVGETELDYVSDDLLIEMESTNLSTDEGLLYSELVSDEFYVGIYTNVVQTEETEITYKRYISSYDTFLVHLEDVSRLLGDNIETLKKVFRDPEDIGYIVINSELGVLSVLPKDTTMLTNRNSVILDLPEEYKIWEEVCEYCEDEVSITYKDATGFNFRDIIVAQLNLEYSDESMYRFSSYSWHGFTWTRGEFAFLDIMIEEDNESSRTTFVWKEDILDYSRGIIGHEGQFGNFSIPEIPLILYAVRNEENLLYINDYVLSTNIYEFPNASCTVTFYKVNLD